MCVFVQVAELKLELKLRGLPVSGTKNDLIERLKPFQDNPSTSAPAAAPAPPTTTLSSVPMEITSTTTAPAIILPVQQVAQESVNPTPPVSPIPADTPGLQQDVGMSEAPSEAHALSSVGAGLRSSPLPSFQVPEEKDRRLHEKERQIEELMRKLEHEQKLVEALKMQLEVEKRASTADCAALSPKVTSLPTINTVPSVLNSNVVKMEGAVLSNCPSTAATIPNSILGSPALSSLPKVVKLEDVTVSSGKPLQLQTQTQLITQIQPQVSKSPQILPQAQRSPKLQTRPQTRPQSQPAAPSLQQFFISHTGGVSQVLSQPQTLLTATGQAGTQILLPVSLPNNATAIQLPSTTVSLQVRANQVPFFSPRPVACVSSLESPQIWCSFTHCVCLYLSLFFRLQSPARAWSRPQCLTCKPLRWRQHPASSWPTPASCCRSVSVH